MPPKKSKKSKRPLSSPENDIVPEKRLANNQSPSEPVTNTQSTMQNNMSSPGYIQPINMSNMSTMANYQTPVGTFYTPQSQGMPHQQQQCYNNSQSPQQQPVQQNNDSFQQIVIERLNSMDKRLSKLDRIEDQLSSIANKLLSLDTRVTSLELTSRDNRSKINDLEASRAYDTQVCEDIQSKKQCTR
ncbi:hypothetical protein ACF0H5_005183 [Mactra antiquata]